jgi:hypothetical protein
VTGGGRLRAGEPGISADTRGHEESAAGLPRRTAARAALLMVLAVAAYPIVWRDAPLHDGDSPQYLVVARDLRDFRLDTLHDRTPGYPLLIVLTDSVEEQGRALLVTGLLLHCAAVWLLAVALRAAGAGHGALLLFCGVLLLPPYVEPAGYVMTENLAQFTLASGLSALVLGLVQGRRGLLVAAGLAFAYAALTRPTYQALAVVLSFVLLALAATFRDRRASRRDVLAACVALLVGTALVPGLVSWANHRAFGYAGLAPMTGFHLSTKAVALWERLPDEHAEIRERLIRARDVEMTRRGGTHTGTQTIWQVREELLEATGMSRAELSAHLLRLNLTLIRQAPLEYAQEVARSMATYWFPPAGVLATMNVSALRWIWAALHAAVLAVFLVQLVVLLGVAVWGCSRRRAGLDAHGLRIRSTWAQGTTYVLAGTIVLYTMVLSCTVDIGDIRQRRPTDALVVLMAFVGATVWRQNLRDDVPPQS